MAHALVKVVDTLAPVVHTKSITVSLDTNTGLASITASQVDSNSADNCSIQSLQVSPSSFDCGAAGANVVVLTVTDSSGNLGTANATVTVDTTGACSGYVGSKRQALHGMPGTQSIPGQTFTVFPNPTGETATLRITSSYETRVEWQLLDLHGRVLNRQDLRCEEGLSDHTLDLRSYASGVYFLRLAGSNGWTNMRIVKH